MIASQEEEARAIEQTDLLPDAKLIAAAPALADALEDAAKRCASLHGATYREHSCGTCTKWLFALNAAGRLP